MQLNWCQLWCALLQIAAYFYVKSMSVGEIAVRVMKLSVEENACSAYAGDIR